jgi:hypothetical protein
MSIFGEICLYILPVALIWHLFAIFVYEDSRYQKYRFRKALDRILSELASQVEGGTRHPVLNIIHKNKQFAIGVIHKKVNNQYETYTIFINGEEAGVYHRLQHDCLSSYHLEAKNHRHKDEVLSIIRAGNKMLKKQAKPKKEKKDGYTEYSYFS